MSVASVAKSAGKQLIGMVESAIITVHDFREAGGGMDLTAPDVAGALAGMSGDFTINKAKNKNFMVQFNPSEIQLYTSAEQVSKLDAQSKAAITASPVPPTAELSTTLYFDHMIVADSFMLDKPMLGLSASSVTNIAMSIGGSIKDFSVQKEVEGFIAAIQNPLTRTVTFRWADFSFTGSLYSVDSQYTMFSNLGRPVRAKVSIRIRQQMNEATLQKWQDDFDEAFSGSSSNLVRTEQNFGNLINLGL